MAGRTHGRQCDRRRRLHPGRGDRDRESCRRQRQARREAGRGRDEPVPDHRLHGDEDGVASRRGLSKAEAPQLAPLAARAEPSSPHGGEVKTKPARAMISSERIAKRVRELGRQISEVYADIDTPLVMVVILKGATVFAADLLRSLTIPAELEFMRAASYGSGTSHGRLRLAHMGERTMVRTS